MTTLEKCDDLATAASALRWWRDAGVDMVIDEAPRQWQAAVAPVAPGDNASPPALPLPAATPAFATLTAVTDWLLAIEDVPDAGPARLRVAPSGDPASGLMVVVDCPDRPDVDAGILLAGELAPLFDKMLAALGRDRRSIYLAALCPGRPTRGLVGEKAFDVLAPVLRRHIELVAPRQLWLLGSAASRAVLGMGDIAAHGKLHSVNLNGCITEAVVTAHPRFLTSHDHKKRAWHEMQRLVQKECS